jgi:hypothetical protein
MLDRLSTIAMTRPSPVFISPEYTYAALPTRPVAINVECAVPATMFDDIGVNEYSAMVTKIPPGPIVVIPMPENSAIRTRSIWSGRSNGKFNMAGRSDRHGTRYPLSAS